MLVSDRQHRQHPPWYAFVDFGTDESVYIIFIPLTDAPTEALILFVFDTLTIDIILLEIVNDIP
jgi:hypothetical protein